MQTPFLSVSLALHGHNSVLASVQIPGQFARNRNVKPGEFIEGAILIKNTGADTTSWRIHQADHESLVTNALPTPAKSGHHAEQRLLSIDPSEFCMQPDETVRVNYRCKIPADQSLKGTFWSMATIEGSAVACDSPTSEPARFCIRPAAHRTSPLS